MTDENVLLKCSCGGIPSYQFNGLAKPEPHFVTCLSCGAKSGFAQEQWNAGKKWNTVMQPSTPADFEEAVRPLMRYLCENHHPHMRVIIDGSCAEMLEGQVTFNTEDYVREKS